MIKDDMLEFINQTLTNLWLYRDGFWGPRPICDFAEEVFDEEKINERARAARHDRQTRHHRGWPTHTEATYPGALKYPSPSRG